MPTNLIGDEDEDDEAPKYVSHISQYPDHTTRSGLVCQAGGVRQAAGGAVYLAPEPIFVGYLVMQWMRHTVATHSRRSFDVACSAFAPRTLFL